MNSFTDRGKRAFVADARMRISPSGGIAEDRVALVAKLGFTPGTALPTLLSDANVAQYIDPAMSPDEARHRFEVAYCEEPPVFYTETERTLWLKARPWCFTLTAHPPALAACPVPPAFTGPTGDADRTTWLGAHTGCTAPDAVIDSHVCPVIPLNADAAWYAAHPACTPPQPVQPPAQPAATGGGMTAVQGLLVGLGVAGVIWYVSTRQEKRDNPCGMGCGCTDCKRSNPSPLKVTQIDKNRVLKTVRGMDGEFEVRLYRNGKLREAATYFTNDKGDALGTHDEIVRAARAHGASW